MNTTPWFKEQKFWQELYPYMFDAKRLARTPEEVSGLIALLDLQPSDKIIDFGCGNGRHLIELSKRGYTHTFGIDSTPYYIELAKAAATKDNLPTQFDVGDMLHTPDVKDYDFALSLFSSFGYYTEHKDNIRVLKNMYSALKSGGKLLIDVRGKENFAYNFDAQSWGRSNDSIILTKRTALDDFTKIQNDWIVIKDGQENSYSFTHWIYSAKELKDILIEAGFTQIDIRGDFAGTAYDPMSKRLLIVATK